MKQQLKDGAIAGAASTLRQTDGVAMDPRHAADLQEIFPTREPRSAALGPGPDPWTDEFAYAFAAH
eukprot:11085360-Prorocentrum_lima.AAC.1